MDQANRLILDGTLAARDALRHTPAGIALVGFVLTHESTQGEAGETRQVRLEMGCIAVEEIARVVAASPLGVRLVARGFLAPRGRSSSTPVLHITELEFKEGV